MNDLTYRCQNCGIVGVGDVTILTCPKCGNQSIECEIRVDERHTSEVKENIFGEHSCGVKR
jgi:predicted RNA-binding Zn-ribbon protein involved in translation (DUF1610 family)